jgi:lincosamide nucleotidyltransferase A/C/D/E
MKSPARFGPGSGEKMSARDVIQLLQLFEQHSIKVVVDGGWGVDALLGEQTRSHNDLDIALEHKDVPQIRALLESWGYSEVPRNDSWECNFVMGDERGREVDLHSYTFDDQGKHIFGVEYPFDSLSGKGTILGYAVRCISPEWMVKFHSGYEVDEDDYHDVAALCERFGIDLPDEYERFTREQ